MRNRAGQKEFLVFTLGMGMIIAELMLPKYAKLNPVARIGVFEFFPLIFCGFSLGATVAAMFKKQPEKRISVFTSFLPFLLPAVMALVLFSTSGWATRSTIMLTMFFFGVIVATIYGEGIPMRIYFFDLAGIAAGMVFYAMTLSWLGPENILMIFLLFYYSGRLYFKTGNPRVNILCFLLFTAALVLNIYKANTMVDPLRMTKYSSNAKPENKLFLMRKQDSLSQPEIIQTTWNLVSRVDLVENNQSVFKLIVGNGLCNNRINCLDDSSNLPEYSLYYDGSYYTTVNPPFYFKNHFGLVSGNKGLIIGMGGGRDIVHAMSNGLKEIVACEINPGVMKLMSSEDAMNHSRVEWDKVTVVPIDGRTYVQYQQDSFDLIQISFAELYMSFPNSRVFMEAYLYTREAVQHFYHALTQNGVLYVDKFSSLSDEDNQEMFRLITTVLEVLKAEGKQNPEKHILVLSMPAALPLNRTKDVVILYVSKNEISQALFEEKIKPNIVSPYRLVFHHGMQPGENSTPLTGNIQLFTDALSKQTQNEFYNAYPFNVTPATDDKPFFYSTRKKNPEIKIYFWVTFLFIFLFSIFPVLLSALKSTEPGRKNSGLAGALSFGLLGGAFGLLQSYILQNVAVFLGSPVLAMVFVLGIIPLFAGLGGLLQGRLKFVPVYGFICFALAWMTAWFFCGESVYRLFFTGSLPFRFLASGVIYFPLMFSIGCLYPRIMVFQNEVSKFSKSALFALNTGVMAIATSFSLFAAFYWGFSAVLFLCMASYFAVMALHKISALNFLSPQNRAMTMGGKEKSQ